MSELLAEVDCRCWAEFWQHILTAENYSVHSTPHLQVHGLIAFTTSLTLDAPRRLDTPHDAKPLMQVGKNNALAREVRRRPEFTYKLREQNLLVLFSNPL